MYPSFTSVPPWLYPRLSNYSLESPVSNLVSLTRSSPKILDQIQTRAFSMSRFLVRFLKNKNSSDYRTRNNIDLKLGPLSKLDKRHTMTSKKTLKALYWQFMRYSSIFGYMVDLEKSRSRLMDA